MTPPPGLHTPVPGAMTHQPPVPAYMPMPSMTAPDHVHPPTMAEQNLQSTLPVTPEPLPTMVQVPGSPPNPAWNIGSPTPASPPSQGHPEVPRPPTTLSAPSPDQCLRPQRQRKPNVRLDPVEWELGKMDTAQQLVPTMDWCLDMMRWIAQREEVGRKREGGDK